MGIYKANTKLNFELAVIIEYLRPNTLSYICLTASGILISHHIFQMLVRSSIPPFNMVTQFNSWFTSTIHLQSHILLHSEMYNFLPAVDHKLTPDCRLALDRRLAPDHRLTPTVLVMELEEQKWFMPHFKAFQDNSYSTEDYWHCDRLS